MGNTEQAGGKLARLSEDCSQCGMCLDACELLHSLGSTPDEIAGQVLKGQVSGELLAAILRCDLCGRCSLDCPEKIDPAELLKTAREVLMASGRISPEDYDVMLVDRDWNFFTIYRESFGIHYNDLYSDTFDTLFFPGCALASYSPELARAAFDWLKGQGYRLGFSDLCCGKPLESIGLPEAAGRYLDRLRNRLEMAGARRIVTACPGCEVQLRKYLPGVEIRSNYGLMAGAGIALSGSELITFHDSCQDRFGSQNPQYVRTLFADYPRVEMASRGENTICCGSGGIVSMVDPDLCSRRAVQRADEFSAAGAEVCMTSCMSCAYRLARVMKPGQVRHCLELVFAIRVDYEQIACNCDQMWMGRLGEVNVERLSQARVQDPDLDGRMSSR